MPRTAEQNKQIREATQATIINSAMVLFAQSGYAHTTTRKIAQGAGISTGLMYHYFDSKESLLHAVFENCMAILGRAFNEVFIQYQPPQRLVALISDMFNLLERDRDFWALFYMMRTQPAIMEILGDSFRLWTKRLRDLFRADLKAMGRAEPELEAFILYSLIEGTIQQYSLDPTNYPLDLVVERIRQQFVSP